MTTLPCPHMESIQLQTSGPVLSFPGLDHNHPRRTEAHFSDSPGFWFPSGGAARPPADPPAWPWCPGGYGLQTVRRHQLRGRLSWLK
ncbi:hypothetical protein MC885_019787 [Smutsia gigantea]|nr:hypothetical protein MC885_019787 [Smutsia gigantea]